MEGQKFLGGVTSSACRIHEFVLAFLIKQSSCRLRLGGARRTLTYPGGSAVAYQYDANGNMT
jgi:hypothetical protein